MFSRDLREREAKSSGKLEDFYNASALYLSLSLGRAELESGNTQIRLGNNIAVVQVSVLSP